MHTFLGFPTPLPSGMIHQVTENFPATTQFLEQGQITFTSREVLGTVSLVSWLQARQLVLSVETTSNQWEVPSERDKQ
jgi:hypothetical protein